MRLRFSIMGLMALVLTVAIGFAALRNPSELWASALFTLAVGLLCVAVLGVAFRHGHKRQFWMGFAVFGWAYLILVFASDALSPPPLLTTKLLSFADQQINPKSDTPIFITGVLNGTISANSLPSRATMPITGPNSLLFYQIGQALATLIVALVGGIAARIFAARADRPQPRP